MIELSLEVPNQHCLKSYKIGITITNFQKLNFKNEVYLTLKNKSLYSLLGSSCFAGTSSQPVKIDLNKMLDPKQKTIQTFNIDAQRFTKTKNENP